MAKRGSSSGFKASLEPVPWESVMDTRDWTTETPDGYSVYEYGDDRTVDADMGAFNGGEADSWAAGLSDEEREAVTNYTGMDYKRVNKQLRAGVEPWGEVQAIERALDRFNLPRGIIVHRRSSGSLLGGLTDTAEINQLVGSVIVDKGFTSSTTTNGTVNGAFGPISYHISVPAGRGAGAYVKPVSDNDAENEFLFNRGGCFRVLGAYRDADWHVHVNLQWIGRKTS